MTNDHFTPKSLLRSTMHEDVGVGDEANNRLERLRSALFGIAEPTALGRFILLDTVGEGTFAEVYRAYDPSLDRQVAIKLLRPGIGRDGVQRLAREARVLAGFSHPNIITVHEVGEVEGSVFLVTEVVAGQTLREWVRAGERSWREVLEAYLQAGRGLAAAHAAGIVHRDFKPENAMIEADGHVRVIDFSLARGTRARSAGEERATGGIEGSAGPRPGMHVAPSPFNDDSITSTSTPYGTPEYMSPEQWSGHDVDPRSDQFNFCVALYEALVSERPFAGDLLHGRQANILVGIFRPLPRGTRVPAWLIATLRRGLSADPNDRYGSMDELLSALSREPARRLARTAYVMLFVLGWVLAAVQQVPAETWTALDSYTWPLSLSVLVAVLGWLFFHEPLRLLVSQVPNAIRGFRRFGFIPWIQGLLCPTRSSTRPTSVEPTLEALPLVTSRAAGQRAVQELDGLIAKLEKALDVG